MGPDGSIEIITLALAARLASSCDISIYARGGAGTEKREIRDGVHYIRVPVLHEDKFLRPLESVLFRRPGRPLLTSWLYSPAYIYQIAKHLSRQNVDVIHIHNFSQFVPIIRRFNPKAKIVLHMHCDWLAQFDHSLIEWRLRSADAIVGVSDYITERVRKRFPGLADRCHTVYNGVNVEVFQPPRLPPESGNHNTKRIIYVGRISPEKGVHILVEAFQQIARDFPDAILEIIGPHWFGTMIAPELSDDAKTQQLRNFDASTYHQRLLDLVPEAISDRVKFVGFIQAHELANFYRTNRLDVFVSPSIFQDPFPLSVLEAMAAGLAVVASTAGGIQEQVKNWETGILVERTDVPALAAGVARLLADPELRTAMARQSRKRAVEVFSWERIVANWNQLYTELLQNPSN